MKKIKDNESFTETYYITEFEEESFIKIYYSDIISLICLENKFNDDYYDYEAQLHT